MDVKKLEQLKTIAKQVRQDILFQVYSAKSGHPGGALSIADTITYLYYCELNVDAQNPKWEERDRFVLSKGHTCPALYAVLAEKGFFDKSHLALFRSPDGILQGHPDMKGTPGVDMTTGSLGHGISAAVGMALGAKLYGEKYRTYAILGDGELQEGQVWEAAMFAAHNALSNLCIVVDNNGLQIDGKVDEICSPYPIDEKFAAFGWNVIAADGHDFNSLEAAFAAARACTTKPSAIIQKSVKGKGVSFMENNVAWHGSAPNEEQYNIAVKDVENGFGG